MRPAKLCVVASCLAALAAPAAPSARADALKRYSSAAHGVAFRYPASWSERREKRANIVVAVGDGRGAQCSVTLRKLSAAVGQPIDAARGAYLSRLTPDFMRRAYPARLFPRIIAIVNATLAGLPAKRIEVELRVQADTPYRLVQWATLTDRGRLVLTCGAVASAFATERMKEAVATVHGTLRLR